MRKKIIAILLMIAMSVSCAYAYPNPKEPNNPSVNPDKPKPPKDDEKDNDGKEEQITNPNQQNPHNSNTPNNQQPNGNPNDHREDPLRPQKPEIQEWEDDDKEDVYTVFQTTDWMPYAGYMSADLKIAKVSKTQNVSPALDQKYRALVKECLEECTYKSTYEKNEYENLFVAMIAALDSSYLLNDGEEEDEYGSYNFYSMHYFGPTYKIPTNRDPDLLRADQKLAINNLLYKFFKAEQTKVEGLPLVNIYEMNASLKRAIESVMLDDGFMSYQIEKDSDNDYTKSKAEQYYYIKIHQENTAMEHTVGYRSPGFAESVAHRYFCSGPKLFDQNAAVQRALGEKGKPYQWGATGPDYYDCSGLVGYAITGTHNRIGTTHTFMNYPKVTDPQPGDICVNSHHTGIYLGNGMMCHAPHTGDVVKEGPVHSDMIFVRYPGDIAPL